MADGAQTVPRGHRRNLHQYILCNRRTIITRREEDESSSMWKRRKWERSIQPMRDAPVLYRMSRHKL